MLEVPYKKVRKLSELEIGYIAGIVDGEGTVTLTVKQKGGTRHLAVTVSGTEISLIKYIAKIIGAGRIVNKKVYKDNHTPAYTYTLFSRQALDLLQQITPYLKTYKYKRAKLVLKDYIKVTPRNGRYTPEMIKRKEKFVEKFFSIKP